MSVRWGWNKRHLSTTLDFKIFEIILAQTCTPLSSHTTLLNPFCNRSNTGLGQFKYFMDADPDTLLLQYAKEQRAVSNRYFGLPESSTVSQVLTRAPRHPASVITSILK